MTSQTILLTGRLSLAFSSPSLFLSLQNASASRLHAIVGHHKEGGLCIMDHNSANGTFVGIRA